MIDEKHASPSRQTSSFEALSTGNASLVREVFGLLAQNKKWWLLPIMGTFLVIGGLVLLSTTAAAPFIYTLF
jgi:hypothetical protein